MERSSCSTASRGGLCSDGAALFRRTLTADEELGAVGVWSGVCHAQSSRTFVLELEILVGESCAIYGLSTPSTSLGKVTALNHKVRDHPVENAAFVSEARFSCCELYEVFHRLWDDLSVKAHGNLAWADTREVEEGDGFG